MRKLGRASGRQFRVIEDCSGMGRITGFSGIRVKVIHPDGSSKVVVRSSRGIAADKRFVRPRVKVNGKSVYLDDFDPETGEASLMM